MGQSDSVYRNVLSPLVFLERSAQVYRNKTAVVHGDKRYTYREFGERVNRLASALQAAGLRKGDRVAFLCPNIPPMLEAHFGVLKAGGILVAVNTRLSSEDIEYILSHSGARYLFVDTELAPQVKDARARVPSIEHLVNICDDPQFDPLDGDEYEAFLLQGNPEPTPCVVDDEYESITINYTSGTTGRPKGVTFCHRGAYINALGEGIEAGLTPESVYLWTLPMFHCNGWCFTWGVTAVGGTHVCLRKFEPGAAWHLMQEENVTHFCGAPVVLIALFNDPARPERFHRPVTVATAGAPPSPTLIEKAHMMGAHVIHFYGLTETYGPFTVSAYQPEWRILPPRNGASCWRARASVLP